MQQTKGPSVKRLWPWLFLLTLSFVAGQRDGGQACSQLWRSGKRTATCIGKNLTGVPDNLPSEIQHLDLSSNQISHLKKRAFSQANLIDLQVLVMSKCGLQSVDVEAFHGLAIVIQIDLSDNMIRELHPGTFNNTERLRLLRLNRNLLKHLESNLFRDMPFLAQVELSDNRIGQIDEGSFRNLSTLKSIGLDNNNLTRLEVTSFNNLPMLENLKLRNNPWNCDCQLRNFFNWTILHKFYIQTPTCNEPPKLVDQKWDDLQMDQLACLPHIEIVVSKILEDGTALLSCHAKGIPRPQLTWQRQNQPVNNDTKRPASEQGYLVQQNNRWINLTIPEPNPADLGKYVCVARNSAGTVNRTVYVEHIDQNFDRMGDNGNEETLLVLPRDTEVTIGDGVESNHFPVTVCEEKQNPFRANCTVYTSAHLTCKFTLGGDRTTRAVVKEVHQLDSNVVIIVSRQFDKMVDNTSLHILNALTSIDMNSCASITVLRFPSEMYSVNNHPNVIIYKNGFDVILYDKISSYNASGHFVDGSQPFLFYHRRRNVCSASESRFPNFFVKSQRSSENFTLNLVDNIGTEIKELTSWPSTDNYASHCSESLYTICRGNIVDGPYTNISCKKFNGVGQETPNVTMRLSGKHLLYEVRNSKSGGVVVFTTTNYWTRLHVTAKRIDSGPVTLNYTLGYRFSNIDPDLRSYRLQLVDFNEDNGSFALAYEARRHELDHSVVLRKYKLPSTPPHT